MFDLDDENDSEMWDSGGEDKKEVSKAPAKNEIKKVEKKNIFDDENDSEMWNGGEESKVGLIAEAKEEEKKEPQEDIFPGDKEPPPDLYQDSAEVVQKLKEMDDLLEEEGEDTDTIRAVRPKKKKRGKARNDLNQVDADQKRIAGLNILVKKLPERNRPSAFRIFWTDAAILFGKSIGMAINWIGSGIARLFNLNYRDKYRRGQSLDTENQAIPQERRRHDLIPGWNGETFQRDPNGKDDILSDFRRVPTIWSRLTAGEAAERDGKPLAPKISVYVRKGNEAEDKTTSGLTDAGHTWIGIEYSRYSRRSNRYERYNLKYGFYPANDHKKGTGLSMTGNALIPAKLSNDANNVYTVSRTFPASAYQVNKILKASETYADKGYNAWNRNCTTFVKDMIKGQARLPVADSIFEQEAPGLSSLQNFAVFAAKSSENTTRATMEDRFQYLGTQQDMSYGGEGNYRATKQDYRQYKQSLADGEGKYFGHLDIPNAVAENMRRVEGNDSGTIGSKQYFGTAARDANNNKLPQDNVENIQNAISNESGMLINKILRVTGKRSLEELCATPGIEPGIQQILNRISSFSTPLNNLAVKDPRALRTARASLEKSINDLNTLLYNFFQNDERLHLPVMHLISLLEWGIDIVDIKYGSANFGIGDLGDVYKKMRAGLEVSYLNEETSERKSVNISPSHYESYLQIYKSPKIAIDKYSKFLSLKSKANKSSAEKMNLKN